MKSKNRLRELDFLRGIAIILVLFRHTNLHPLLKNMGWIGVDLFFVLSGYLVSSLLFKEYKNFGKVSPMRFLIRRGFKIYPLYYLTLIIYLIPNWKSFSLFGLLGDVFFIQNYIGGWGHLYAASWSLAIEEHFYFGLVFLFWFGLKKQYIQSILTQSSKQFEWICLMVFIGCLLFRVFFNYCLPELGSRNFTFTHLRIDSLLAGVLLAFWINFKFETIYKIFLNFKLYLIIIIPVFLAWTPFLEPLDSIWVRTIGFSLLYCSFTLLLSYFLLNKEINSSLDKLFSKKVIDFVAKIGFCSYSIYIIHTFVNLYVLKFTNILEINLTNGVYFLITTIISIISGFVMTNYIEGYFLKIRNLYFPSKIGGITVASSNVSQKK